MADVILAPAALLGKLGRERNAQPINESSHLPLGNEVANIKDKFNDNYVTVEYKNPTIPDSKVRNSQTNEHQLTLATINPIGKKSTDGPAHVFDQTAVNKVNRRINDDTTLNEYRAEKTARFNRS